MDAVLARMRAMLVRTLGGRIAVELVRNGETWPALANALQLEGALLNLHVNARNAMPGGGRLTIETANIRLGPEDATKAGGPTEDYVMIAVSDTGAGMPPEVLARACDPFFTTKEPGKSTGLGLRMVYGFVEQSKGRLPIRSDPGRGTTVTLYLPRAPPRSPRPRNAPRNAVPQRSCWSKTIRGCARPPRRSSAPFATRCSPSAARPRH